jgi:hypothetical protein
MTNAPGQFTFRFRECPADTLMVSVASSLPPASTPVATVPSPSAGGQMVFEASCPRSDIHPIHGKLTGVTGVPAGRLEF